MAILPIKVWPTLFPEAIPSNTSHLWAEAATRLDRYRILSSFADGTIYESNDANGVKQKFRAYKKVRPIYNPCGRIVEFHASHLMGGQLDGDAGPGMTEGDVDDELRKPTALPIIAGGDANQEAISRAVASIWGASNWQTKKTLYTRWGTSLGDVGLETIPDKRRKLVRIRVVHPAEIVDKEEDSYGNIKYYSLERWVRDDKDKARLSKYRREVINEDGVVTVRTFKGDVKSPYQWPGDPDDTWVEPWGFIPLVMVKHIDCGQPYGEAEQLHAIAKSVESDSQGSALSDGVVKSVVGKWFMTGTQTENDPITGKRKPIQLQEVTANEENIIYGPKDSSVTQMVIELQIDEASQHRASIGESIADDYPELMAEGVGLNASGEARKEARRKAEKKIVERRAAYDDGLRRALQMGMTMGGVLGFGKGQKVDTFPFNEGSFDAGLLDFSIGKRPVFDDDPAELQAIDKSRADEERVKAETFSVYFAGGQGAPLLWAMRKAGATDEELEDLAKQLDDEEAKNRALQVDTPAETEGELTEPDEPVDDVEGETGVRPARTTGQRGVAATGLPLRVATQ